MAHVGLLPVVTEAIRTACLPSVEQAEHVYELVLGMQTAGVFVV